MEIEDLFEENIENFIEHKKPTIKNVTKMAATRQFAEGDDLTLKQSTILK